jgi:endonuclease YncB( thermonuclease family)
MAQPAIFWDPSGFELDSLGAKKYIRATDGDTPYVSVSIRMLSIDTPEVHYPGNKKPSKQDDNLAQLADWIQQGKAPIQPDLASYLQPKLATGNAGTLQEQQGEQATDFFERLIDEKLTRPNSNRKRKVYLRAADEPFDQYGRLLAYMAPHYSAKERAQMSPLERATFNLLMVESGWAATFIIYPSLPSNPDLKLMRDVAQDAVDNQRGVWANNDALTGYEFRTCVRLYEVTNKLQQGKKVSARQRSSWITRYCADMTTREIYYPQNYHKVKEYNRIFIWSKDVSEAVGRMNLLPAS